ncbi:MAG: hemG [Bacteroidetes bacterium]|nr:hemG [Bacteroidota bacterium]
MKLLIVYGTTEGQTRKIAEFLKSEAQKTGTEATLCDATTEQADPDHYDAVILASSIHMGRYQASISHYIRNYVDVLNNKPSAFLSISLTAAGNDPDSWMELMDITNKFLSWSGWKPSMVEQVAGALRFVRYDFFKAFIMRQIAKKAGEHVSGKEDKEYTDWTKLSVFITDFLKHAGVTSSRLSDEILG